MRGAQSYDLHIYQNSTPTRRFNGRQGTSRRVTKALPANVTLEFKVRARNASGAGAWSKSLTFIVASPTAMSPIGTITSATPTFQWERLRGAVSYDISVTGGSVELTKSGLTGLSYAFTQDLPTNVPLAWKVRGANADGQGAWSQDMTFTVAKDPNPSPSPPRVVTKGALTTQPSGAVNGVALSGAPVVQLQDAGGNDVASAGVDVVATIASGSGTLSGTTTVATDATGKATFSNLIITGTAGSYTLDFTPTALTKATSNPFSLAPGAVSAARSTLTPTTASITADGSSWQRLTVQAKDGSGNNILRGGAMVLITKASGGGSVGLMSDHGNGTYTTLVTSPPTTGSGVFVATIDGSPVQSASGSQTQATISYVAGAAAKYLVTSSSYSPVAGSDVTISAQLADAFDNAVATAGTVVTWASTNGGSFATPTSTTNASGIATVVFTTNATNGTTHTVTGTSTGAVTGTSGNIVTKLQVGDPYQGGIVGYLFQFGDPGYVAGQTHGLIAAAADQSTEVVWALPAYQTTAVPGGTNTAMGSGPTNTANIVSQNGAGSGYAAGVANAYAGGGYHDWYLPSRDELYQLYLNRTAIGGFETAYYWSSSQIADDTAWLQSFGTGSQVSYEKNWPYCFVRAVRSF